MARSVPVKVTVATAIATEHKAAIDKTQLRIDLDTKEAFTNVHIDSTNTRVIADIAIANGAIIYGGAAMIHYWREYSDGPDGSSLGLLYSLTQLEYKVMHDVCMKLFQLYPHEAYEMRYELKRMYPEITKSDEDAVFKQPEHLCCAYLHANHFTDNDDFNKRYLFLGGSKFNHSCRPNCRQSVRNGQMTVYAICDILPGEECTIKYWDGHAQILSDSVEVRQAFTLKMGGFVCKCNACVSATTIINGTNNPAEAKANITECSSCHKPAELKCGRCKLVVYCNIECQRKDWKLQHKKICCVNSSTT